MTTEHMCVYGDSREERLIAYVYNDMTVDERGAFDRHLTACLLCREEVDGLREVRRDLRQWASPEPGVPLAADRSVAAVRKERSPWAPDLSVWLRAAAAVVALGAGASLANLEISYQRGVLTVNTGWRHGNGAVAAAAAPAPQEAWQAALSAVEQRLQQQLSQAVGPVASTPDESTLRQFRTLVAESEQRQQRETALKVAEMARQVEAQRQSDLVRIDRNLGLIQSRTGAEVMRTQQQVNSLAQRVAQRQEP